MPQLRRPGSRFPGKGLRGVLLWKGAALVVRSARAKTFLSALLYALSSEHESASNEGCSLFLADAAKSPRINRRSTKNESWYAQTECLRVEFQTLSSQRHREGTGGMREHPAVFASITPAGKVLEID